MKILTAEDILGANDIAIETVEVPEWGGAVRVKGMDGAAGGVFQAGLMVGDGASRRVDTNYEVHLCCACICDESGRLLFSREQVAALAAKSYAALHRVAEVAGRLSGLSTQAADDAKKT